MNIIANITNFVDVEIDSDNDLVLTFIEDNGNVFQMAIKHPRYQKQLARDIMQMYGEKPQ